MIVVSFLIPTRGRLETLLEGIESIKKNASPDVQVEILVRIDQDDYETLAGKDMIRKEIRDVGVMGDIIVGPRWGGYHSIYIFYNEMAAKSHGDWLVLWNDDTFMATPNWDKFLPPLDLIDPKKNAWITWFQRGGYTFEFPVMTRKLYELWGCFAPGAPADHYIHEIWVAAGKPIPLEPCRVTIEHRRSEKNIKSLWIKPEDVVRAPLNSFSTVKDLKTLTEILRNTQ